MTKQKEIDWKNLIKKRKAFCYIKPTMKRHDSGYRCFEVGYLTTKDNLKMKEKKVLEEYSDHIWNHDGLEISMDLLLDGYIRIFDNNIIIAWGHDIDDNFVCSSAMLEEIKD